jgi:hypothetical protein
MILKVRIKTFLKETSIRTFKITTSCVLLEQFVDKCLGKDTRCNQQCEKVSVI